MILIVLANAAAVLLFSGAESVARMSVSSGGGEWPPVLALVADLVTLPIPTEGIADIRDAVLPFAAGLALLLVAAADPSGRGRLGSGDASSQNAVTRESADNGIVLYFSAAAGAVVLIAILSAAVNQSFDLSWGWIIRFAAGGVWAIVIASSLTFENVRRTWTWLLGVGGLSLILAIAQRADRGYAHFTWPIGPITPTAALAAVWAAMSAAGLAVKLFYRRLRLAGLLCIAVLGCSVYVLFETGRRAPALGLAGALLAAGAVLVLHAFGSRTARAAVSALVALAIVGGGAYVVVQYRHGSVGASGPVALRFELWRLSAGLVADRPSLGAGADSFICEMTNAVAPHRGESPHYFHGNVDTAAHNEWIQAAVELGVPGALFYAAIPIGVLLAARRRFEVPVDLPPASATLSVAALADRRTVILSLAAGLTAILITEGGSINLRVSILPVWYWTLIGLLAACCRQEPRQTLFTRVRLGRARGALYAVAGMALLSSAYVDAANACVSRRSGFEPPLFGGVRLFAEKTLGAWWAVAQRASAEVAGRPDDAARVDAAVRAWRRLYERIPGWTDVPAQYSAALLAAGSREQARHVLTEAIGPGLNRYQAEANVLYALDATDVAAERFRCMQRALRNSRMTEPMRVLLNDLAETPACQAILRDELPAARMAAAGNEPPSADALDIELLRISAFLLLRRGEDDGAIADQRLAAAYTAELEKTNSRYRRAADAETDVHYTLAKMLFERRPADYRAAFEAIRAAEYYAVLGIAHELVADPRPELGYIFGVVVPTEFPERLAPLWRLSALLQIVAEEGAMESPLLLTRILSYLPAEERVEAAVRRELASLCREACAYLERVPPGLRPGHYDALRAMVESSSAAEAKASGN